MENTTENAQAQQTLDKVIALISSGKAYESEKRTEEADKRTADADKRTTNNKWWFALVIGMLISSNVVKPILDFITENNKQKTEIVKYK